MNLGISVRILPVIGTRMVLLHIIVAEAALKREVCIAYAMKFLFIALLLFSVAQRALLAKDNKIQPEKPFVICTDDSACSCSNEDHEVDCNGVVWTQDESGDEIYSPLRTANLKIGKKDFETQIGFFRDNDIPRLEKGRILPGHEATLKELDFTSNRIYKIEKGAFTNMSELRVLKLSRNMLRTLDVGMFQGGPNWMLHSLLLDYNHLLSINEAVFDDTPNLERLVLDGNPKLAFIKRMFQKLIRLRSLSLDECNISALDDDLFEDLTSLEELSLRDNPMSEIPKALTDIPSLLSLDLSLIPVPELQSFAFSKNKKLENLFMENLSFLYTIKACAFCGMTALKNVVLSNATELYHIDASAFGWNRTDVTVPKLKSFNVEFANLTGVSPNLLDTSELDTLKLGGNKWVCDCELAWVLNGKIDFNQGTKTPMCNEPKEFKGRAFNSLTDKEICVGRLRLSRLILSLSVLVTASMVTILLYYVITNYRIRNVFYRPDAPRIGYSNLNSLERDEDRRRRTAENAQSPPPEEV